MKLSAHAMNDRMERINYIKATIGFGYIIKALNRVKNGREEWACITSTGVMMIQNKDRTKMVTAFVATVGQAKQVYQTDKLPDEVYKMIVNNRMVYEGQPQQLPFTFAGVVSWR